MQQQSADLMEVLERLAKAYNTRTGTSTVGMREERAPEFGEDSLDLNMDGATA